MLVNKNMSDDATKNKEVFDDSIGPYQEALSQAGYQYKLHFDPPKPPPNPRNRQRNATWFNPPYCKSVKTNVAKEFLKILAKCFPKENVLSKIFNKNTVKVSYCCMPSISRIISGQNKKVLEGEKHLPECRCTLYECPIEGLCEKNRHHLSM